MKYYEALQNKLKEEERAMHREFVAPAVPGCKIRVRIGRMTMDCPQVFENFSGWGVFRILSAYRAALAREAEAWEKEEYTRDLPRRSLRLLHKAPNGAWWALDVEKNALCALNLAEGLLPFDRSTAAFDGSNWWHVAPDLSGSPQTARLMRRSLEAGESPESLAIPGLKPHDLLIYSRVFALGSSQGSAVSQEKIREALKLGNARMLKLEKSGENFMVTWQKGQTVLSSLVDKRLSVITAGRCLSGLDAQHDITSLASLMPDRETYQEGWS